MPKIETSTFVNWEHNYVYPLVIKGYNDPNPNENKPKTDKIDSDLGRTIHDIEVNKAKMELELRHLAVAEAKARMLMLGTVEEATDAELSADLEGGEGNMSTESDVIRAAKDVDNATGMEMIDFAKLTALLGTSEHSVTPKEDAPWRYTVLDDDDDVIAAPRSYSMPSFKKK
jgi:hypothetical protein